MKTTDRFEHLVKHLRDENFRITPQRLAMLKLLVEDDGHPSAAQIYEQMRTQFPTTSLATVYKMLNVLKAIGEVQEIGFSEGDNRYDITKPYPHVHLICVQCRSISDADLHQIGDMKSEIEKHQGFRVLHQRIDFFGICAGCQNGLPT